MPAIPEWASPVKQTKGVPAWAKPVNAPKPATAPTMKQRRPTLESFGGGLSAEALRKAEFPTVPEEYGRPALELGGMAGGALIATPTTPAGQAAVGALGYAGGKSVADVIYGKDKPQTIRGAVAKTGKDIIEGAAMEAGGRIIGAGVPIIASGIKKATPEAIKTIPNRLYQSAAKFSTTIPVNKRAEMADLAIKNRIMPTVQGWEKVTNKINSLGKKVSLAIDDAAKSGEVIKKDALFKHLDAVRADAKLTGTPKTNLSAINNIENQIRSIGDNALSPQQAQKLKQNIYKSINTAYGKMSVPYKVEAQKAVARAAKEGLEELYPDLKIINAKEGAFLELREAIEAAANRITNRDLLGIGIPIKATAGSAAGGPGMAAAGLAQGILDAPRVKSALAIALSRLGETSPRISKETARQAAYAIKNYGRNQEEQKNALAKQ